MKFVNVITGKLIAFVLAAIFFGYFVFAMVDTSKAIADSEKLLASYNEAITKQEEIEDTIEYEESIQGSDEQIEKIARERLGLCKSNEKIFIDGSR